MTSGEIQVLTHEFAPTRGGIAVYVEETARAAAELGLKVTVRAPGPVSEPQTTDWGQLIHVPLRGNQNWPDRLTLRMHLLQADVNWQQSLLWLPEPGPIRLWMYADLLRLPVPERIVLTLHGSEILRLKAPGYRKNRFQALLDRAWRVGVVSKYVQNLLLQHFKVDDNKLVLVPGALRHDFVLTTKHTAPSYPPWKILTVARLHPRKGQHHVIEAIGRLPSELRESIVYIAVGPHRDSSYVKLLQSLAESKSVHLELPGIVADQDLPTLYSGCHLFAFTPEHCNNSVEGLGLVCLEAAAAGLPIIGFATGGVPEAVAHGVNGLLVVPDNDEALSQVLEQMLGSPELLLRMSAASPHVAQRYSWAENCQRLFL